MSKKKGPSYKATRTETHDRGDQRFVLVAGEIYDDLPEDLVKLLSGGYGGLEEVAADE